MRETGRSNVSGAEAERVGRERDCCARDSASAEIELQLAAVYVGVESERACTRTNHRWCELHLNGATAASRDGLINAVIGLCKVAGY